MTKYLSHISRTKKDGTVPVPTGSAVFIINFNVILFIFYSYLYSFTNFYTCLDLASTAVQAPPVPQPL